MLELADSIEEIKTVCTNCNRKAIINAKIIDGEVVRKGSDEIVLGGEKHIPRYAGNVGEALADLKQLLQTHNNGMPSTIVYDYT